MSSSFRSLVYGSLLMALGLVFPMMFHTVGLGRVFLPMFWPLALAGYILNPFWAVAAGILTPALSSISTGMPPVPVVWRMMIELALLPGITALLIRRTSLSAYVITPAALLISLLGGAASAWVLAPLLGWPARLYALSSVTSAIPGILCMAIVIPWIFYRLKNHLPESH